MKHQYKVFDCDIHQSYMHQSELYPYLPEPYLSRVKEKGLGYPASPYASSLGYKRPDSSPPPESNISSYDFLRKKLFEELGITKGVLNGHGIFSLSYIPETDYPAKLAWAYNQWLINDCLEKEPNFYGSLHIALQNPKAAAKMILELGKHPRIIQVILPSHTPLPITHEFYSPIIDAIAEMNLVLAIHPWQPSILNHASTPVGNPMSYVEWRALAGMPTMSQLVSITYSDIFVKHPHLNCLFLEGGFSWLPFFLWRMDQLYKSFRSDVPWLEMMPSEYVLKHCKFGTQPIEEPPPKSKHLQDIIEMMHGHKTLVYASDFPHWDADNPDFAAKSLPVEYREDILYNNAMDLYGL